MPSCRFRKLDPSPNCPSFELPDPLHDLRVTGTGPALRRLMDLDLWPMTEWWSTLLPATPRRDSRFLRHFRRFRESLVGGPATTGSASEAHAAGPHCNPVRIPSSNHRTPRGHQRRHLERLPRTPPENPISQDLEPGRWAGRDAKVTTRPRSVAGTQSRPARAGCARPGPRQRAQTGRFPTE